MVSSIPSARFTRGPVAQKRTPGLGDNRQSERLLERHERIAESLGGMLDTMNSFASGLGMNGTLVVGDRSRPAYLGSCSKGPFRDLCDLASLGQGHDPCRDRAKRDESLGRSFCPVSGRVCLGAGSPGPNLRHVDALGFRFEAVA